MNPLDHVISHRDSVEWGSEQERSAEEKVQANSSELLPQEDSAQYETGAAGYWDSFYEQHQNRFFKDRHWLFTEFPELKASTAAPLASPKEERFTVFEVSTLFSKRTSVDVRLSHQIN